jgi:hypothetical protein
MPAAMIAALSAAGPRLRRLGALGGVSPASALRHPRVVASDVLR